MKEIKINLEHHELFKTMSASGVKRLVLGLMSAAKGEEVKGIPHEIWPTFVELRAQLEACGESIDGYKEGDDRGFDKVFEAYEKKRMSYEEKSEVLTEELKKLKKDMERGDVPEEERGAPLDRFVGVMADIVGNLERERNVLKEENALLKGMRKTPKDGDYTERVLEFLEGMLGIPKMSAATPIANSADCVSSNGGAAFTPEDWKVIDNNWETLKDAIYRLKIKKEALQDIHLPAECWKVVGKYFHELSALFHL